MAKWKFVLIYILISIKKMFKGVSVVETFMSNNLAVFGLRSIEIIKLLQFHMTGWAGE